MCGRRGTTVCSESGSICGISLLTISYTGCIPVFSSQQLIPLARLSSPHPLKLLKTQIRYKNRSVFHIFFFFSLFFLLLSGIIFFFFLLLHLLPSALCHFSFQNNIMFQQSHFRSIFSSPSFRASMQRGNATHWLITRWLLGDWLSCSCCAWPNRTNAYRKIDFSISFYIGIVVFLFVHRALHTVIYMSKYLNLIFEQILKKGL